MTPAPAVKPARPPPRSGGYDAGGGGEAGAPNAAERRYDAGGGVTPARPPPRSGGYDAGAPTAAERRYDAGGGGETGAPPPRSGAIYVAQGVSPGTGLRMNIKPRSGDIHTV